VSYLAGVKKEMVDEVDRLREEVLEASDEEAVITAFEDAKKSLWAFMEKSLKDSYRNGQAARRNGGGGEAKSAGNRRRFLPWKRRTPATEDA
jgi:hypothetical protein